MRAPKVSAMARRVLLLLVLALGLAAPAFAGDGLGQQKATLDAKLAAVQAKIAREHARESRLNGQIGGLTTQIHSLEARVGDVSSKLSALQADLALHQRRLAKLNELYRLQTIRFRNLRHEYTISVQRLDQRLVTIYKQSSPSTVDVLLAARSFQDVSTSSTISARSRRRTRRWPRRWRRRSTPSSSRARRRRPCGGGCSRRRA